MVTVGSADVRGSSSKNNRVTPVRMSIPSARTPTAVSAAVKNGPPMKDGGWEFW